MLALVALGGGWAWYSGGFARHEDTTGSTEIEAERPRETRADEEDRAAPAPRVESDRAYFDGILLTLAHEDRHTGRVQYCAPTDAVRRALIQGSWKGRDLTVVRWDPSSALTLMVGPGRSPGIEIRDHRTLPKNAELLLAGSTSSYRLISANHSLVLDQPVPDHVVVFDLEGRGVGYGWHGTALPLGPLLSLRSDFTGQSLEQVLGRMQAMDPSLALEEARRMLRDGELDEGGATKAVDLLNVAQYQARDRETIEAIQSTLVRAHQARVRLVSAADGPRALRIAQDSLAVLGNPPEILADAVLLALAHGSADQALAWYAALLSASSSAASRIRHQVLQGIRRRANEHLRAGDKSAAARLLAEATRQFPDDTGIQRMLALATAEPKTYGNRVEIPVDANNQALTQGTAGATAVTFLVDTGASNTTIPHAVASALGLLDPRNPVVKVETAGGVVEAQQVVIPKITIEGKITVTNVQAMVLDLPGSLRDKGLLGMNVLRQLSVRMDSRRGKLILSTGSRKR